MRSSLNVSIAAVCALRRFRRDRNGAVAIQFAMIALPFFMMMFAIIEICMIFFATQVLETATQDTARLIMTGQAQMASMTATQFKTDLCARLAGLFDCAGVDVDVKSYPTFASISINNPISGGNYNNPTTYSAGDRGPDRRGSHLLSMAAVRDQHRLQRRQPQQQQAAAGFDRFIPQRTGTVLR